MPERSQAPHPAFQPVLSLDLQGCILEANNPAAALLGLPGEQCRAKPLVVFICDEYRRDFLRVLRELRQSSTTSASLRCELEPGARRQRIPVQLTFGRSGPSAGRLSVTLRVCEGNATAEALTSRLTELERRYREAVTSVDIGLQPRPLHIDGLDLGFEAVSGDHDSPFGGDLCDWQELPDGQIHLCVVDATGRGLLATRAAVVVRSTVRLLALTGCAFEDLLERAEHLCEQQEPGISAAVTVAHLEPSDGRLQILNAGNPPPLITRRDGSVSQIDATGTPFGHGSSRRHSVVRDRLDEGEALVLFTDGLIGADGAPRQGMEDLRRRLERSIRRIQDREAGDRESVRIAHGLLPTGSEDDALAMVLRRPPSGPRERNTASDRVFSAHLTRAGTQHVGEVRQNLTFWLSERPVPRDVVRTALLIVSELATNAIRAARSRADVRVSIEADGLQIEVVDDGHGIQLDDLRSTDLDASGYGLHIIESVCEDVQIMPSAVGTVVRCHLPIGRS